VICCDVRVFVNARRLVAAVVLAGCGVVLGALPAEAGTQADAKRASAVFTGTVTEVDRTPRRGAQPVTATYGVRVDRVYKGDVGTETVRVASTRTSKGCRRLVLAPERAYVFFVRAVGSAYTADACSGTAGATGRLIAKVQRMLGDGRLPVPARPEQALFTRVAGAEPATLTRTAAPGLALVLVGLLGLVVVRRLGAHG